jgi:hypothetical protein
MSNRQPNQAFLRRNPSDLKGATDQPGVRSGGLDPQAISMVLVSEQQVWERIDSKSFVRSSVAIGEKRT